MVRPLLAEAPPWCLALAGPTASGKTAAALALAQHIPLEIISVDSALVYRGMDIGTAKPSLHERTLVPHHLIDILNPQSAYSAARFAHDADLLIGAINRRGRLALLVGGTMLYFKALINGLHAMPPADPAVRAVLAQEASTRGWPALHAELARIDPVTAARLAPNDSQRVQRALEVYRVSGRTLSALHGAGGMPAPTSRLSSMPMVSLEPKDRAWLHQRIAERFDTMLAQGFLDEVRALRSRDDLHADLPAMRCVGYRQAWEALDGQWPMDAVRERSIAATRQLAKRQITWLRSMPKRHSIACDDGNALAQVLAIGQHLAGQRP